MTIWQAIVLGLVQGITEFLPVSSSAHLVILQRLFELKGPILLVFDVVVHVGTLLAVLLFFGNTFLSLLREDKRIIWLILAATIPTGFLGLLGKQWVDLLFLSLVPVATALLFNSAILWSTRRVKAEAGAAERLPLRNAFLIGVVQGIAVIPGISRAGSTISAALWLRFSREEAFRFSFLISIPAILGATAVILPESLPLLRESNGMILLVGFVAAFFSGYGSLRLLSKVIQKGKLHFFAIYTLFLSAAAFYFSFIHPQ